MRRFPSSHNAVQASLFELSVVLKLRVPVAREQTQHNRVIYPQSSSILLEELSHRGYEDKRGAGNVLI